MYDKLLFQHQNLLLHLIMNHLIQVNLVFLKLIYQLNLRDRDILLNSPRLRK